MQADLDAFHQQLQASLATAISALSAAEQGGSAGNDTRAQ